MGFGSVWCNWIHRCISTASISILINGLPTKSFRIRKGLSQGCPMSHLLLNIVTEALSSLIKKAVSSGFFREVSIGNKGLSISHLQFADDLIIFCGASKAEVNNIIRILRGFEVASGLKLNLSKSTILGVNVASSEVKSWAESTKCRSEEFPCKYLGLPLRCRKNSIALWTPVIEQFEKRFAGWKAKLLSLGGSIVMVKSVLENLPVFFMSIFHMLVAVSSKLNSLITKFIWGWPGSQDYSLD
ncbi:hypothetical protein HRI_004135900 [Hibiscus trionum]|uniref:Reverse transcriptase domain-containing protein n=1 Tax=Hibiscus trionum TaxID=183268 RepID=A0A9W7J100_HIBTR|nr:hypothetical protein HRI_004135900 [Hibiscus trionum]